MTNWIRPVLLGFALLNIGPPALAGGMGKKEFREAVAPTTFEATTMPELKLDPSVYHGSWVEMRVAFTSINTDQGITNILVMRGIAERGQVLFNAYHPGQSMVTSPFFFVDPDLKSKLIGLSVGEEVIVKGLIYDISSFWGGNKMVGFQRREFAMRVVAIDPVAVAPPAVEPSPVPAETEGELQVEDE